MVANEKPSTACPKGHLMTGNHCSICTYRAPLVPGPVEIRWGGKTFEFESMAEAKRAGFNVEQ